VYIALCCSLVACVPTHHKAKINDDTQLELGLIYLQLNQYALAKRSLTQAILSRKTRKQAQITLAYLYQRTGHIHDAENLYRQMIKTYSNFSEVHNNYGVFLCQTHQYQYAIAEFDKALKYNAKNINAQKNLTLCRLKNNNPDGRKKNILH
jgi:type IV pilus assembly protein PilF